MLQVFLLGSRRVAAVVASTLCWLAVAFAGEPIPAGLRSLDEPDPARDARVAWHQEARFGCFIHWGVYSAIGGVWPSVKSGTYSEHLMRWAKIPRAEYLEKVVRPFDPEQFDADTWVRLFRDAGMRYVVITAKHHDGFAMYPSKVSDYNITRTRFKRDPMRELRDACTKYGLKFGFYYSHAFDWEHPDAPGNDWDYDNPGGDKKLGGENWWEGPRADFLVKARQYVDQKAIPQLRELIAMYHPDILWFDTPHKLPPEENFRILAAVRAADPNVVVNGRLVRDYGDYKNTADRPAEIPYTSGHWEGIPTTNESYGWSRIDHSHKPASHFIVLLAKSVSKGGNMLLNIGPMGDGEIDPVDANILRGIGTWMQRNGESIYGCDRTPLAVQNWGTSTWNPHTHALYLHVFHWPTNGKLLVGGLKSDPTSAHLLAGSPTAGLSWHRNNANDLELTVPTQAPDAIDSVVRLEFPGAIDTDFARYIPNDSPTLLHVMDGRLTGAGIEYGDGKRNNDCTLRWSKTGSGVEWPIRLVAPLRAEVRMNYATASASDGGTFELVDGGQKLGGTVHRTETATGFETVTLGTIDLPAGDSVLSVRAVTVTGNSLMKLRSVDITPKP